MAIKTVLIDDFDGTPISGNATTTHFSLNDTMYQIDLSAENVAKLKDALAPFIKAGRKVAAGPEIMARDIARAKSAARRTPRTTPSNDVSAIREWAKGNGFEVSERGRIPGAVLAAYESRTV